MISQTRPVAAPGPRCDHASPRSDRDGPAASVTVENPAGLPAREPAHLPPAGARRDRAAGELDHLHDGRVPAAVVLEVPLDHVAPRRLDGLADLDLDVNLQTAHDSSLPTPAWSRREVPDVPTQDTITRYAILGQLSLRDWSSSRGAGRLDGPHPALVLAPGRVRHLRRRPNGSKPKG